MIINEIILGTIIAGAFTILGVITTILGTILTQKIDQNNRLNFMREEFNMKQKKEAYEELIDILISILEVIYSLETDIKNVIEKKETLVKKIKNIRPLTSVFISKNSKKTLGEYIDPLLIDLEELKPDKKQVESFKKEYIEKGYFTRERIISNFKRELKI